MAGPPGRTLTKPAYLATTSLPPVLQQMCLNHSHEGFSSLSVRDFFQDHVIYSQKISTQLAPNHLVLFSKE